MALIGVSFTFLNNPKRLRIHLTIENLASNQLSELELSILNVVVRDGNSRLINILSIENTLKFNQLQSKRQYSNDKLLKTDTTK